MGEASPASRGPDPRIGVLHLISGLTLGGAERMVANSARFHDRAKFRLGVVSLMKGGALADRIRQEGVPVTELGWRRGRITPAGFSALRREARGFSPAILEGHMFHGNLLARLLRSSLPGAAILNTHHSDPRGEPLLRRAAYAATASLADAEVRFGFPRGRPAARARERTVPYGIESPPPAPPEPRALLRRWGIPPDSFLFLAVGRLHAVKGFDDLLAAMALLPPSVRLLVAGEGPERGALMRQAAALRLSGRAVFAGERGDVPDLMAAADAFVLSSRQEAGPLVVMEAQACGLPVVATRVGQVEAMVEEGKDGLLVPPGRPWELAVAMGALVGKGETARAWGAAGREKAGRDYPFARTQAALEEIYRELAGPKGRAR